MPLTSTDAAPPLRRILRVIGIGAGDPNHLTLQAIAALKLTDVFFIPEKRAEAGDLARIRRELLARFVGDRAYRVVGYAMPRRASEGGYAEGVERWHEAIAAAFGALLADELGETECGAFLVWGDPSLYDSTLRILERLVASGRFALDIEVIPGISAPQALAARHGVALNAIGAPVLLTPGRRLVEGIAGEADGVVIMLDVREALAAADPDLELYWGANLGLPTEALVRGRLGDVIAEVERLRTELRAEQGWIFETALLRRRGG